MSYIITLTMLILVYLIINKGIDLEEYFFENLSAELFGILIEIFIIIFVFDRWKKIEQDKKNIIYEKRLREYLLFFLKNSFNNLPNGIGITTFYGIDYLTNKQEIEQMINYISSNNVNLLDAKKRLLIDKTAYENLLEVASHLTDEHFKAWIRIVYFINSLSLIDNSKTEEIKSDIINLLTYIQKFDEASFENNIYVGFRKNHFILFKKLGTFFKCE